MSEIKLRAFHKEWKTLDKVISIDWGNNLVQLEDSIGNCDWVSLDDVEVMQYTGLKDKNGVEIYEGDILKYVGDPTSERLYEDLYEVKWIERAFVGVWLSRYESYYGHNDGLVDPHDDMEVIGNIHQDTQLLETPK